MDWKHLLWYLIRFTHQLKAVHTTELKSVWQLCGAKKACPEELTEAECVTCLLLNSRTAPWSYLHMCITDSVNLGHETLLVEHERIIPYPQVQPTHFLSPYSFIQATASILPSTRMDGPPCTTIHP